MLNMYGLIRSQELVRPVGKDLVVSDTRHPTPRWVVNKEDVLVMSKADRIWDEMYKTFKLQHILRDFRPVGVKPLNRSQLALLLCKAKLGGLCPPPLLPAGFARGLKA